MLAFTVCTHVPTLNICSQRDSSHTEAESLSSASSAQIDLKDPTRLEDSAWSSQRNAFSCLEMVLQEASLCGYTTFCLVAPLNKVTQSAH